MHDTLTPLITTVKRLVPKSTRQRLRRFPPVYRIRNASQRRKLSETAHDDIYDDDYFDYVDKTTGASADTIAESIVTKFAPASVMDVGCGTGAVLNSLRSRGVEPHGIECAEAALTYCKRRQIPVTQLDLNDASAVATIAGHYDVALSMEVGQQLTPEAADPYVELLSRLADTVVFSSDTPGGYDRLPLNEQTHGYWIDKFQQRGFHVDESATTEFRCAWEDQNTALWFHDHVIVFQADTALESELPTRLSTHPKKPASWTLSSDAIRTALDLTTDAVLFVDPTDQRIVHANEGAFTIAGFTQEEMLGLRLDDIIIDVEHRPTTRLASNDRDNGPYDKPCTVLQRKDGSRLPVKLRTRRWTEGSEDRFVVVVEDISDRRRLESLWSQNPLCDALTGLPDRLVFESRLGDAVQRTRHDNSRVALFFIDLDDFKQINDTHGHLVGDQVLRTISRRIVAGTRPGDVASRYGGDEFVLLVERVSSRQQLAEIANRVSQMIVAPVTTDAGDLVVSASIGIACATSGRHATPDELVRRSDRAMYRAKASRQTECWIIDEDV